MSIVASAPGKIVLAGEYAVLMGAPAICVAVDRRAVATLRESDDGECHLATPGYSGEDRFRVVDAVFGDPRPAREIELDTRAFAEGGVKLGLGSSAALTVALAAACRESTDVFATALRAHRVLQGGKGSGVDIAAAVHGGLIEYEMQDARVQRLHWPSGLRMRVIWTGVPSSTSERIDKLVLQSPRPSRSALLLAAPGMAEAWVSGEAQSILVEYLSYIGVLRQFSIDHELGIFDAGHEELTDAAVTDGLVYKPAGAGGGDIGVLFGTDDEQLDTFVTRHRELVHRVVPCVPDSRGVCLEQT